MTLREAIQALREYALTPQTGPDATGLAEAYREIVGDSVSHMLQEWKDDGELRREAQKLAAAMDDPQLGSRELDSVLRGVTAAALTVLDAHGTERALDLLCVGADPDDPAIQAAVDEINIARGVGSHPHSAGYVKLENYGVNHMSGRGRRGTAYLREHVHRIVRGETEPQAEKAAPEKTHMPPERRDEPRTLGG